MALARLLYRAFEAGLGDGPGPLDGLLIPGALQSLCILLCLNRINFIQSDGNLLSWLLGPFGLLRLAFSPFRTVPEESDRPVFYTPLHAGSSSFCGLDASV